MDLLRSPTNDRIVHVGRPAAHGPDHQDPRHGPHQPHRLDGGPDPAVGRTTSTPGCTSPTPTCSSSTRCPRRRARCAGLRQKDDIHMSDIGGTLLSWVVLEDLGRHVDLSGSKVQPDPNDLPPGRREGAHRGARCTVPRRRCWPRVSAVDQGCEAVTSVVMPPADVPPRVHRHAPRGDGGHQVVEDAVGHVLVERPDLAVAPEVELERLELDQQLVGHVGDGHGGEVGLGRQRADAGQLGRRVDDLVVASGVRVVDDHQLGGRDRHLTVDGVEAVASTLIRRPPRSSRPPAVESSRPDLRRRRPARRRAATTGRRARRPARRPGG